MKLLFLNFVAIVLSASVLNAQVKSDPLVPYAGESIKGVDTKTLEGKIMAGTKDGSTLQTMARDLAGHIGLVNLITLCPRKCNGGSLA